MMKPRVYLLWLIPGLLAIQDCAREEPVYQLFSGTLPVLEIGEDDSLRYTEAKSIFLHLMEKAVEYEGEIHDLELLEEVEEQISFRADFSLQPEVQVTGLTFVRPDSTLILHLGHLGRRITLEPYDRMMNRKVEEYAQVSLEADISHLSDNQRKLLGKLFRVADIMDEIYWNQVFADKDAALANMMDPEVIRFFRINYGPWERLNGNLPFIPGYGPKPPGSGFYPGDMTRAEFEALENEEKSSQYTLIRRDDRGDLMVVPYHEAYGDLVRNASDLLLQAAGLAEDEGFGEYLRLRAEALLTDDYYPSDLAWMDMRTNAIDFVVGPIENYEDALFNYKAAHESFILIKDKAWSRRLEYINSLLPRMQKSLPVDEAYKQEMPGSQSDLAAYDVVYYAGDCNAGSKTIAINLPNDERVQERKGSRKLQLKNAIRAKFEEILVPISNVLIAEDQRDHVTFDAFFENTMYHEVAHGLGLNMTVDGKRTVRSALMEQYSPIEEGKADILGLFLVTKMVEMGMMEEQDLLDNYVTFMASIFRSIRFGVASSHGKANMIRFYYFQEKGAFTKDLGTGTYRIHFEQMQTAMNDLAGLILTIQGDGNYPLAKRLVEENGLIREELQADLDRLRDLHIPVDIVFNQGPELLGL